jgi:uncharacterized protein (DUF983 family)
MPSRPFLLNSRKWHASAAVEAGIAVMVGAEAGGVEGAAEEAAVEDTAVAVAVAVVGTVVVEAAMAADGNSELPLALCYLWASWTCVLPLSATMMRDSRVAIDYTIFCLIIF